MLLIVRLTTAVQEKLRHVQESRNLTVQEALAYALRNGVKVYFSMQGRGNVRLIDPQGNLSALRLAPTKTNRGLWPWLSRLWSSKNAQSDQNHPTSAKFQTEVDEVDIENITLLAGVWGYTRTDVINQAVYMACEVDRYLVQGYSAYLVNREGQGMGPVSFD